jgi:hypothetical protein
MPMNRVGTFTVEIQTRCNVTGQEYKISFPLTVTPPAK